MTSDTCTGRMERAWSRSTSKSFTCQGNQVSCHTVARSSSVMKLRIFNSWLQKLLMGSAEINLCSRNSCGTSPTELREDLAWVYFSGEVSDAGFWNAAERWLLNTSVRQWCSLTYWRIFRDDIFAITSNFPRFKHVFICLPSRAALEDYKLLTEDVSQNRITFLAVDVLVVNGCFATKPRKRIVAPFPQ